MKIIGISELKELVNERLANTESFACESLVLWNASYMRYGIAYRVIEECCIEYNKANPEKQVWLKDSDMTFASDDNTDIQAFCDRKETYGYKSSGILFNTGCFLLSENEQWLKFVNTHQNEKGGISANWALIACAQTKGTSLTEADFAKNCKICKIQPTVEEWVKWTASCHNEDFLRLVIAYNKGNIDNFDYWERALFCIEREYESLDELKQTTSEKLALCLCGSIPDFPIENFWDYIHVE